MPWSIQRNRILFWAGLGGLGVMFVLWAAFKREPDPQLVLVCTGMIGLTAALRADEQAKP